MPTSLFSPETQAIFDRAAEMAGRPGGPFASPADWRDQSIYFIIVDRFNNPKSPPVHYPFDDPGFFDCFVTLRSWKRTLSASDSGPKAIPYQ